MKLVDLTEFGKDGFVLRFEGRDQGINAITYGKVLISISNAIESINRKLDPEHKIEIIVVSEESGCFKVFLKPLLKYRKPIAVGIWATVLAPLLVLHLHSRFNPNSEITINGDVITIIGDKEETKIKATRDLTSAYNLIQKDSTLNRNIDIAARAMRSDKNINKFGIYNGFHDQISVLDLSKIDFDNFSKSEKRKDDTSAIVTVHKAIFERSSRKWEFLWGREIISATISDDKFFDKMEERQFSINQGEKFLANIRTYWERDKISGNWIVRRYVITDLNYYRE